MSETKLYAHAPSKLLPLLRAQLPHTLSIVGTILSDAQPTGIADVPRPPPLEAVYATFPPGSTSDAPITPDTLAASGITHWLVAVALPAPSIQIRVYHSLLASPSPTPSDLAAAEEQVEGAIRTMARLYPAQSVVGNVPESFLAAARRATGGGRHTPTYTYVAPGDGLGRSRIAPPDMALVADAGLVLDHGRPGDAPVIHETNKYRSEEYYALRAAYSTSLRPAAGGVCEVWVMTHGDGSLGALWTQPDFRRRGLARVVLAAHLESEERRGVPRFCYIEEGNEASMKLFESLGWAPLPTLSFWVYDDEAHPDGS